MPTPADQPPDPAQPPTLSDTRAAGDPTLPPEADDLLRELRLRHTPAIPGAGDPTLPAVVPAIPGYEVAGVLGRGGMGVVYKARQTALNRPVALKMVLGEHRVDSPGLVRFLAEAEAVAAVRHPNVVQVYDLGHHDGRPYFAMEYVDGGSLADRLRDGGKLNPREAALLVTRVARGVAAAHEAGIVHRDLKPGNVLLAGTRSQGTGGSPNGSADPSSLTPDPCLLTPKVSDFGLAKRLGAGDLTRTQMVMGTPAYMAPEQAGGKAKFVGPQADVYALGVILYECLTGDVPFPDEDTWSLIRKVLTEPPRPPRALTPGVPRDLELICLKCLAKEPHERYPSAAELADDLDRFLAGRSVTARPIPTAVWVGRWIRRNPAFAALVGVLLALAVGVPSLVIWNQGRLDRTRAVAAEAEKARAAAEALAAAREVFALTSTARRRALDRPVGWTRDNLADLRRAAGLADEPGEFVALRSGAAGALLAADLRPAGTLLPGLTAATAAPSPDGNWVALGEFKARAHILPGRVFLVDPATGAVAREFLFPPEPLGRADPLKPVSLVQDGARSLAFAPDGKHLFVGTRASRVYRFDLGNPGGLPAAGWKAPGGPVDQLAVSPDGKAVYGLVADAGAVVKWAAESGTELARFGPPAARAVGFAVEPGTGDLIVSDGPHLARLDPATMTPRGEKVGPADGHVRRLMFAPGGRVLVAGVGDRVDLADPGTLRLTRRLTDPDVRGAAHEDSVGALAAHPSRAYLASAAAGGEDRQVKVWELGSGQLVGSVAVPGTTPIALAWSPDGRFLLATGPDQTFRFEFAPPAAQRFAALHPHPLEAAAFGSGGKQVAALSEAAPGSATRSLLLGSADGGPPTAVPAEDGSGNGRPGLAVAPDSGQVAVSRPGLGLLRWDPGQPRPGPPGLTTKAARGLRYSPDGSALWAVVDSSSVWAWDAKTGEPRGRWSNAVSERFTGLPGLDALAVGRTRAVAAGRDGTVAVLNDRAEPVAAFRGLGDPVLAVALAPDEGTIAAGTRSGGLRVIWLADGSEHRTADAHPGGLTAAAFGGEYLATGGRDRAVRVWRVGTGGRCEPVFAVADLPAAVRSLEFAPAGDRLLVLVADEHAARVWDLAALRTQLADLKLGW